MLELIFQGFMEWAYGLALECWEYFSSSLLDIMSMDYAYMKSHVPVMVSIAQVLLAVGWALLIGNLVFQALKSMAVGLGFEGEDPKLLFTRTFVFAFLLMASPQICEVGLSLTARIIELLEIPDGGRHLVPSFHQFQYIPGFCLLQRVQQPVQNEQLHLFQMFHIFPIGPIPPGYSDLHQKIRQPEIPSGVEVPVGCHTQGTGQECLSSTGSAQDDHISCLLNVRTGCQAEDLLPVQMPFGNILDILHAGLYICIAGVVLVELRGLVGELTVLAAPFAILHPQQAERDAALLHFLVDPLVVRHTVLLPHRCGRVQLTGHFLRAKVLH